MPGRLYTRHDCLVSDDDYEPLLSKEAVDGLRIWHERAYKELKALGATSVRAYGLQLETPEGVFPPG